MTSLSLTRSLFQCQLSEAQATKDYLIQMPANWRCIQFKRMIRRSSPGGFLPLRVFFYRISSPSRISGNIVNTARVTFIIIITSTSGKCFRDFHRNIIHYSFVTTLPVHFFLLYIKHKKHFKLRSLLSTLDLFFGFCIFDGKYQL